MINCICRFVLSVCFCGFCNRFCRSSFSSLRHCFIVVVCCAESVVVQSIYINFFGGSVRVLHNMLAQIVKASVVSSRQAIRGSGFILSKRAYHEKVNEPELNPPPPHAPPPSPPPKKIKQSEKVR